MVEKVYWVIVVNVKIEFDVVLNLEFLCEGFVVDDFMKLDCVVIGIFIEWVKKVMENFYKLFVCQGNLIYFMDECLVELIKYVVNFFFVMKIIFMNEVVNFCEFVGVDVDKVCIGIGLDECIGKCFLFLGIGYGGFCFLKDVQVFVKFGKDENFMFCIFEVVMEVNEDQKIVFFFCMKNYFCGNFSGRKIVVWGLVFKFDMDDICEVLSFYMIWYLFVEGVIVIVYDLEVMLNVQGVFGD